MRPVPHNPATFVPAALAVAALLAAGSASAEPSSWVDPPAKSAANAAASAEKPDAKTQARPADTAQAPERAADEAVGTPPRRPKAAEVRRERRIAAESAARATPSRTEHRPARLTFEPERAQPRMPDQTAATQRFAADYLGTVSAPGATMVAAAPRFYGERVRFHGRSMSLSALMAEKSRFVRRWPERRYAPQGAMRTACEGETCTLRTAFTFEAADPARGARSRGLGELTLTVDFGDGRPRIVSESSRVLHYGGAMVGAADRPGRGA